MLTKLFELMAQKKASDLFVSAGAPIHIKINGNAVPVNPQPLTAEDAKRICYEILKPHQIEKFEKELELNFSTPIEGIGNFRINMMWQKGTGRGRDPLHRAATFPTCVRCHCRRYLHKW